MTQYQTRFTLSKSGTGFSYCLEKTDPTQAKAFTWSYFFKDNSYLVGQVKGQLEKNKNTLLNPTEIQANYISSDGKTILINWKEQDFIAFDATIDGTNSLIIASNDNCIANSMCLISGQTRSRAQATDKAIQLVAEPFNPSAWSLHPQTETVSASKIKWDWQFLPFFPFVAVSFNLWVSNLNTRYRWTTFPYFPLLPFVSYVYRI